MASLFTSGARKPLKRRRKYAESGSYINGLEWLAVLAVSSEPVSRLNSLIYGKKQGISQNWAADQ